MKNLIVILFLTILIQAQTDWTKWEASETDYKLPVKKERVYKVDGSNIMTTTFSTIKLAYWFFISDLDGANCPFEPSCSEFFTSSLRKTNILKASLMFSDRFIRDLNLFKMTENYPIRNEHFYDPFENYLLNPALIRFYESE